MQLDPKQTCPIDFFFTNTFKEENEFILRNLRLTLNFLEPLSLAPIAMACCCRKVIFVSEPFFVFAAFIFLACQLLMLQMLLHSLKEISFGDYGVELSQSHAGYAIGYGSHDCYKNHLSLLTVTSPVCY